MIAGFASVLGKQARGTVLLEATQQTKHLTPLQADQHTGVSNTQTTRLNPQQHLKPAELLLAHRQHRQGAPPGTPEPGGVSPLSCRGVSSLYCAYSCGAHNARSGKFAGSAVWDCPKYNFFWRIWAFGAHHLSRLEEYVSSTCRHVARDAISARISQTGYAGRPGRSDPDIIGKIHWRGGTDCPHLAAVRGGLPIVGWSVGQQSQSLANHPF